MYSRYEDHKMVKWSSRKTNRPTFCWKAQLQYLWLAVTNYSWMAKVKRKLHFQSRNKQEDWSEILSIDLLSLKMKSSFNAFWNNHSFLVPSINFQVFFATSLKAANEKGLTRRRRREYCHKTQRLLKRSKKALFFFPKQQLYDLILFYLSFSYILRFSVIRRQHAK